MKANIVHFVEPIDLGPGIPGPAFVESICPRCQKIESIDLYASDHAIPAINRPFPVWFAHEDTTTCNHEWSIKMIARMGIFECSPARYIKWSSVDTKIHVIKAYRLATGVGLIPAKKWAETGPHSISRELAVLLEEAGAVIEWRY